MPKLIILGSSNSIPDANHENTHMVLIGQNSTVLIDCANNPIIRLKQAGIDFNQLSDIILTHFHPDHVSGVPLLLMDMWLMGRKRPLNIFGLQHTMDRMEDLMGFYGWSEWPNFFPVVFYRLPASEMVPVIDNDEFEIHASLVNHMIPCIGLRLEGKISGKVIAYSSDTEPCDQVVRLAENADVMIHEATGSSNGHSSASQAGEIAKKAFAKILYLIHNPTGDNPTDDLIIDAKKKFDGSVYLAEDFLTLDI
jgi:ribonuclease Z